MTDKEKIMEWHKLIVNGLVNGLGVTHQDERTDDVNFWKTRSHLFDAFAHCVLDLLTEQDYKYSEKDLKEISEMGWKNEK